MESQKYLRMLSGPFVDMCKADYGTAGGDHNCPKEWPYCKYFNDGHYFGKCYTEDRCVANHGSPGDENFICPEEYPTCKKTGTYGKCYTEDGDEYAPNDMADVPITVLRTNVECKSDDTFLGKTHTLQSCAYAAQQAGGHYFIFGKGSFKGGWCYVEHTSSDSCSEGFETDNYDFYRLDQTIAFECGAEEHGYSNAGYDGGDCFDANCVTGGTSWYGSRTDAKALCAKCFGCTALHDYGAEGRDWRACASVTKGGDEGATVVHCSKQIQEAERAVAKGPAFSKTTHKNTDPPNAHYHDRSAKQQGQLHAEKAVGKDAEAVVTPSEEGQPVIVYGLAALGLAATVYGAAMHYSQKTYTAIVEAEI